MTDDRRINKGVCFIGGTGHSGSTMLGLILGSHPKVFYAGEGAKTLYLHTPYKDLRKRVCKLCGPDCPIWGDFHIAPSPDLYEQLSQRTGAELIVDSTKKLEWITSHVKELEKTSATPFFIFLQRDGRAVINSRVRKYPDRDPEEQISHWLAQIETTRAFFDSFPHPKAIVRYEELALDPESVSRKLCRLLGLEWTASMIRFYEHDHHPLGGNNGTQSIVARHQNPNPDRSFAKVGQRSRTYYEEHGSEIRLDLRWRKELSHEVLAIFEDIAGEVNAPMRWDETD